MSRIPDLPAAFERFLATVGPYDTAPGSTPVAMVRVRVGQRDVDFPLTAHTARAIQTALANYRDPSDRGECAGCGSRKLDDNFNCYDCGRVNGIFGEVLASHAEKIQAWGDGADKP